MPTPRNDMLDAFFDDEWGPPHGALHYNKFTGISQGQPPYVRSAEAEPEGNFANYLDRAVNPRIGRPEIIPARFQYPTDNYYIFIPDKLMRAARRAAASPKTPKPNAKVTILFAVGTEMNRHGLRSFFASSDDQVLITVPGRELEDDPPAKAWGIGITGLNSPTRGITINQIAELFKLANAEQVAWDVKVLACYSTGYRGLNGTINNNLIPLDKVERIIIYDALYKGNDPPPGNNTERALQTIKAATGKKVKIIAYDVTDGGTPYNDTGKRQVDARLIDQIIKLKSNIFLFPLLATRILNNGLKDGFFPQNEVPSPILRLISTLPRRGMIASSQTGLARAPYGSGLVTLDSWGRTNIKDIVKANSKEIKDKVMRLVCGYFNGEFQFLLLNWNPCTKRKPSDPPFTPRWGELLHDGFIPEFGWEFLPG